MSPPQIPLPRGASALALGLVGLLLGSACDPAQSRTRRQLEARGLAATDEAFLQAVADGDRESLTLLLALGIRPEASLLRAVRAGRCELLPGLVSAGVVVDGVAGARALVQARRQGVAECVETLEGAGARREARTEAGENLLTMAAAAGRERQIGQLLGAGFPVDEGNSRGETALLVAARTGDRELIERLLHEGADVAVRDVDGWSALAWAAREGRDDQVRSLLAAGAPVDATDLAGWTALAWASRRGHASTAALLLAAGADPNRASAAARTPLVWAATQGAAGVAEVLLAHGADPALAFDGASPARWAELTGHEELAGRLRAATGKES